MKMTSSSGKEYSIYVYLWKEVGLCIHRNQNNKSLYNISHYNSGRTVLIYIPSLAKAKEYLQKVYDEVMEDWRFTIEEWDSAENEETRKELKNIISKMQEKVYYEKEK